ncbi:MAG: hypothetical protein WD669_08630 [Pirellulales bacterium]
MIATTTTVRYWTLAWLAAAAIAGASSAHASVIAEWTFETSQPLLNNSATITGILPEVGVGIASGVHASSATDYSNPTGNGSNESFNSNNWAPDDYYQFSVSTLGLANITFAWDQTTSASGSSQRFKIQADFGSGLTDILNPYFVRDDVWNSTTPDPDSIFGPISLGAAAADQSTILVRITGIFTGSPPPPPSGTSSVRVDNVTISGDPVVPEPATWLTVGGCLLLGWAVSSRR